ncbi:septum formation protein Maf [Caulobacter sp. Root1455]|uniref:Maf family protein n=1 Tax=unclassified Caulobacter TaxID=2648921 RepID=UPI0006F30028|nr:MULTISPECIES: Maf family protein [unclassified Caulobacter]KQY35192.1 septum formation protein Maf [Caulobacter sp. Root487D2Y]KQZ05679.1 septum formation protein Maf [Caulobacter sp. Root1455]
MTSSSPTPVTLASKSSARQAILRNAGVVFEAVGSGVDEDAAKAGLLAEGASPREVADALAELKAFKVSTKRPGLVIGSDQTLELDGTLLDKVDTVEAARERLIQLRGKVHKLHSAVVVARDGRPIWRVVETAQLSVRPFSDAWLDDYLERNGPDVLSSVGCYFLEGEGVQMFDRIDGDYFAILGLPVVGLFDFLRLHGALQA